MTLHISIRIHSLQLAFDPKYVLNYNFFELDSLFMCVYCGRCAHYLILDLKCVLNMWCLIAKEDTLKCVSI